MTAAPQPCERHSPMAGTVDDASGLARCRHCKGWYTLAVGSNPSDGDGSGARLRVVAAARSRHVPADDGGGVPLPDEPSSGPWDDSSASAERNSWAPVDLGPYLRGEIKRAEPAVGIRRSDGMQLLYPGKEHSIVGEMESGKSWFSLACAADELASERVVVYIHFEEADPTDSIERLLALGVPSSVLGQRFRFVGPEQPVRPDHLAALMDPAPSLVILDGVNEAMALHAQEVNDTTGVAAFRRRLVKPFTAVGAAVLACDHVVKDPERRGAGLPMGSVHKGNGLSGALLVLETAEPFGRDLRGRSHVFVTKDRPGHLRRNGRPSKVPRKFFMGELVVDDTQEFSPDLQLKFWAPSDGDRDDNSTSAVAGGASGDEHDEHVLKTVNEIIKAGNPATKTKTRAVAGGRASAVDSALERLVHAGRLREEEGRRNARVFVPTLSQDQEKKDA